MQTENDTSKDVEIMVLFKCLSNFWRTLEMPLIKCEINLALSWSINCFLAAGTVANEMPIFTITDKKTLCSSHNFINSR